MAAPLVGKRVVVDGLAAKPELNGTKGTATSFDDAKGRYNLKMDAGGMLALKPTNVLPDRAAGGGSEGGGVPGFGGMGGLGPGGIVALLAQLMQRVNGAGGLPFGLTPQQLGLGALALVLGLRALGLGVMHGLLVGGLLLCAAKVPGGGARGLESVAGQLGRLIGRPVTTPQAGVVLAAVLLLGVRYFLGGGVGGGGLGGGGGGSGGGCGLGGAQAGAGYDAYTKGFNDGKGGRDFEPITDSSPGSNQAAPSKWGMGSLLSLAMLGSMLWQLGGGGNGQPWSAQNLVANLKTQSPIHLLMMFNMLSGLLF